MQKWCQNLCISAAKVGFSVLLVYANILQFLRGFDEFAAFVQMLANIMLDMIPFLTIMLILVLGFSTYFFFSLKITCEESLDNPEQVFAIWYGAI